MKPLALTMGDPAGIGGELSLRAWLALRQTGVTFVALDDPLRLRRLAAAMGLTVPVQVVANAAEAGQVFRSALPVLPVTLTVDPLPGKPDGLNAKAVVASIEQATKLALAGEVGGVVTNPINKAALRRDFGIAQPRLAIAGLNPHAGEQGALGTEETTIVQPAIDTLRAEGIDVSGPWPPDTMFTAAARTRYDVAICMYHDQALIPLKTLDMDHGVNVTLGLPIVRTSPDHGTAFDIAGKGLADATSLLAAIELAGSLAARRTAAQGIH